MERLDAATSSMNELFDVLLDISKLDAAVVVPKIEAFAIGDVLDRIDASFAPVAQAKGLLFEVAPCQSWVRSDPVLLERILQNLVSNAIRYTEAGSVRVGCFEHTGRLRIDVIDTGIGIDPSQQQDIFTEFFRAAGPGKLGSSGLGLGLFIVDRLAHLLGHTVELQSQKGHGSTFSVFVPLGEVETVEAPSPAGDMQPPGDFGTGSLALVIDDDPLALDGMTGILEGWGFEVVGAKGIAEALAAIVRRAAPLNLIVSDYHLPDGERGLEAVRSVRLQCAAEVPAVLVTGDSSTDPLAAAKCAGLLILRKPVLPLTLRAVVSRLVKPSSPNSAMNAPARLTQTSIS